VEKDNLDLQRLPQKKPKSLLSLAVPGTGTSA